MNIEYCSQSETEFPIHFFFFNLIRFKIPNVRHLNLISKQQSDECDESIAMFCGPSFKRLYFKLG